MSGTFGPRRTPVSRVMFDYSTNHLYFLSLFFLVFKVASNFENVRSIVQALIRSVDLSSVIFSRRFPYYLTVILDKNAFAIS